MSHNAIEDEEKRLRNILLEQIKKKNAAVVDNNLPTSSIEDSDGSNNFDGLTEENFEEVELNNLFSRQKSTEAEFQRLKATMLKTKQKLAKLELHLEQKSNLGVEISKEIKSHFESFFLADFDRLNRINEERTGWKTKLNQRTTKAKERIKTLKENTAMLTLQPKLEPKIIPLSPIRTPPAADAHVEVPKFEVESSVKTLEKSTSSVRESRSKTVKSTDKKRHHSKSNSNKHSSSKKEHKRSKKRSSRDKRLDKLADKLSINHIVGDGKSKDQAEAELLKRMLDRNRRKHRSSERLEKRRRERSKSREESKPSASRVDDAEFTEVSVQSLLEPPPTFHPTQSVPSTSFSTITPFVAQDAPIQHPIMNIPSYNIPPPVYPYAMSQNVQMQTAYPTYTFDSTRMQAPQFAPNFAPTSQFAPTSSTVPEIADQDMRISDHEIISRMLQAYPRLCPPMLPPAELASKLLEANSVDYVAKMLSQAIPDSIKEHCFSPELKHLISSLVVNK